MLALRLPEKLEKRLARLAAKTGRTKSYYAREAIAEYIDDLENYYLALKRIEDGRKSIPLEEIERRLGLAD